VREAVVKNKVLAVFTVLLIVFGGALASAREKPARDTPMSALAMKDPAKIDPSDLLLGSVGDLHETGTPQVITDLAAWRLELKGAALGSPLSLTYAELAAMPMEKKKVLLICPGFFADYVEWEGVPVSALLEKAKARTSYVDVVFSSWDGYTGRFEREEVESHSLFLALRVNGETLPAAHGFPVRLVAEDIYGSRWVKWVTEMRVD
jgi:DMSO/TMAO reductase YedYZ molybdopterin-dependent catalytic subunit